MSFWSKPAADEATAPTVPLSQRSRWDWVGSPAFAAVVTFLVVLAGAAASLFTEGIRAHSLSLMPTATSGWGAFVFWVVSIIAVSALLANQRILKRNSERERDALSASLGKLDSAVKRLNTLPNEGFLPSFQDSYGEAFAIALMTIAEPKVTKSQVDAAIRAVLTALTDTAKDFDGATQSTVYSANIMIFRARNASPSTTDALGLPQVSASHGEYAGALELVSELSTSSSAPGKIDAGLVSIHLPIPSDCDDYFDAAAGRTKSCLIPGAPTSYVKGTFDAFATIDDFLLRLRESSIDRVHVGTIQKYFTEGAGRRIKSFASLPIMDVTAIGQEAAEASPEGVARTLAVLNLQSEANGLLADNGATLFAPLAGPFLNLLAILLLSRQEAATPLPAADAVNPAPESGVPNEHPSF